MTERDGRQHPSASVRATPSAIHAAGKYPHWWSFELELSPHVEERMIDRGFTEVDLRLMIEAAEAIRPAATNGRWIVETAPDGDSWEVIVEPEERDRVVVVIAAYRVTL